ncbi:hypothetical protein I3842_02G102000 [Carya illinoinensis]|uniref:Uncharacterized protein n=1 Tax=Carya illinoinensis TaxID=32201 RepID=A0A922FR07_CARIL|nr:hypothetical protein I3842_02G102000 [Carya illinoinensis]
MHHCMEPPMLKSVSCRRELLLDGKIFRLPFYGVLGGYLYLSLEYGAPCPASLSGTYQSPINAVRFEEGLRSCCPIIVACCFFLGSRGADCLMGHCPSNLSA